MQPYWYSFSSWPHSDITSLGRSVTCPRLFLQQRCFWDRIILLKLKLYRYSYLHLLATLPPSYIVLSTQLYQGFLHRYNAAFPSHVMDLYHIHSNSYTIVYSTLPGQLQRSIHAIYSGDNVHKYVVHRIYFLTVMVKSIPINYHT